MPKIKIIRELAPKIKEIKEKAEAGKEEKLEEEIEDVEEQDFSRFISTGKFSPAMQTGEIIPQAPIENIEELRTSSHEPAPQMTKEEAAAEARKYNPSIEEVVPREEQFFPQRGFFESPELAHLRRAAPAQGQQPFYERPVEEKKETRRKMPWEI